MRPSPENTSTCQWVGGRGRSVVLTALLPAARTDIDRATGPVRRAAEGADTPALDGYCR